MIFSAIPINIIKSQTSLMTMILSELPAPSEKVLMCMDFGLQESAIASLFDS